MKILLSFAIPIIGITILTLAFKYIDSTFDSYSASTVLAMILATIICLMGYSLFSSAMNICTVDILRFAELKEGDWFILSYDYNHTIYVKFPNEEAMLLESPKIDPYSLERTEPSYEFGRKEEVLRINNREAKILKI